MFSVHECKPHTVVQQMTSMLHQILRRVMHPKIWRYVCLVSSIVGLLCYALSSSFNHLFGNWNFFKLFLYTIFSFIICLAVLFAKINHTSGTSLPFKAHLVFFVFTISTVYSFFFDKASQKPDSYVLISNAAFAIMSLCLSKQTHFGFEVDLLYFFCGCLTLQLMRIRLFLMIVGVSFSYSLIILCFYLAAAIESGNLGIQIQDQNSLVIRIDSDLEESITAEENVHLTQPQEAINSESADNINSDAFQENSHIILPQETINSESATIINFYTLQENTHLILPRETINSESAPLLNFDAPQENSHLNEAQETIHSESAPIMNFDGPDENIHLIRPQENINSEIAPIMNLDAPPENREVTQVHSQLQHNTAQYHTQRSTITKDQEKERQGHASLVRKKPFGAKKLRAFRESMMRTFKSLSAHD